MANHHKRNSSIPLKLMAAPIAVPNVAMPGMHKASPVQQRNTFARLARSMDTLQASAFQSRNLTPNIVHIKSQLRRSKKMNLKRMKTPAVMTALYCIR